MSGFDHEVLWNSLPVPALVVGSDECVSTVNAAAEQFFTMSARTLSGRNIKDFAPEGSRLLALLRQARNAPASLAERGVEIMTHEAVSATVDVQVSPLNDIANSTALLVMIQPRSIAEKMDRNLAHRGAARSVSGMAAALSHEIKNPLAAISGAAQLLQDLGEDQEAELAELIQGEAHRIGRLVDRMEHFTDERPPARMPVNLHDALETTRRAAKAGFAQGVRFVEEYDPSLPPTAGDRDQLAQAFQNLVKNAAEAVDKSGEITLKTAYRPGVRLAGAGGAARQSLPLEVSIMDNGRGIPADLSPHIFEPFVTSKASGAGLGLALVSKIVADHGGVISCESNEGRTVFRMLLPVWDEREDSP